MKEYEKGKTNKVKMSDGRLLNPWDDEFRVPGTFGTGSDTHKVPEHLKEVKIAYKAIYPTFEEYMEDWCGYEERDPETGKYGYWHNPKAKWDWHELGGRWTGFFKLKEPKQKEIKISKEQVSFLAFEYGLSEERIKELIELRKKGLKGYEEDRKKHPAVGGGYYLDKKIEELLTPSYEEAKVGKLGLMTDFPEAGWV